MPKNLSAKISLKKPNDSLSNPKLLTLETARQQRDQLRRDGLRLVLTNGCFDLLHTGHLFFLQEAARRGDMLWVLLNGDAGVRALKGPLRPVQSEQQRAYSLAALACVQGIILFDHPRAHQEMAVIQPDVYVKAGDYTLDKLDPGERQALESAGTLIEFLPFLEGFSTTALIERIRAATEKDKTL